MPSKRPAHKERSQVLILVQNLPVPFDRRVWQEGLALTNAGYDVHIVCPRTKDYPLHREMIKRDQDLPLPAWPGSAKVSSLSCRVRDSDTLPALSRAQDSASPPNRDHPRMQSARPALPRGIAADGTWVAPHL